MTEDDKRAFLERTQADELGSMRIMNLVRAELSRSRALRSDARTTTEVAPAALDRVRRQVRDRLRRGGTAGPARGLAWPGAGIALVLAAVLLALGYPRGPERSLVASGDVKLELDGLGTIGGTDREPEIRWESGRLSAAVTPDRGVHLAVVTPEATVRVIGTAFAVERAEFATEVTVTHGTVEVTCAGRPPVRLPAPGHQRCLPVDAPTLLRRATALRRLDADPALRLEAVDAGLAVAGRGPLEHELLAQQASLFVQLGRTPEALASIERYLRTGGPRASELTELAVGSAGGPCGAERVLEAAVAADPAGRWAVRLASCVIERDRSRAAALLDRVDDAGALAPLEAQLRARLAGP